MSRRRAVGPLSRVVSALALTVAASVVLLGLGVPSAAAHDQLLSMTPADGTSVASAPAGVDLEFSRPLPALGAEVVVTGPDGTPVTREAVQVDRTSVTQPLAANLPAGTYTVAWRVTSADGHPISGTSSFRVTGGSAPSAEPVQEASSATQAGSSSGPGLGIGIGAAVVLLTALAIAARQLRSRS